MESFPRTPEASKETRELLQTPEQVFDSDREKAEAEAKEVAERLLKGRGIRYEKSGLSVRVESGATRKNPIKIAWPRGNQTAYMLQLDPISEGQGAEAGVLGYTGRYGVAKKEIDDWVFTDRKTTMSLEQAFCVPEGKHLAVKPTIHRWAIGKDELSEAFGKDTYTLYMGLGFALLGEPWMYIGMHEGGHIPTGTNSTPNKENLAWTLANTRYAQLARKHKDKIVKGETAFRFEILRKPFWAKDLTIGKVMRYGLVSHALAGNAVIPKPWQDQSSRTLSQFGETITAAEQAFNAVFGKPNRFI